jgi:hypothetical protein
MRDGRIDAGGRRPKDRTNQGYAAGKNCYAERISPDLERNVFVQTYFDKVRSKYATGDATEHSYRTSQSASHVARQILSSSDTKFLLDIAKPKTSTLIWVGSRATTLRKRNGI